MVHLAFGLACREVGAAENTPSRAVNFIGSGGNFVSSEKAKDPDDRPD
jgi:hypothetical protein